MALKSAQFLTGHLRKYPLYRDIIIPLLDWVLDATEDSFQYITGKYLNYQTLDVALAKELIREVGYGYILDAVILDTSDARVIFGYLKLFHILKGSKEGFRFVLSLLGYEFDETEWFQDPDTLTYYSRAQLMGEVPITSPLVAPPYAFLVNLFLNLSQYDSVKIHKIIKFSRYYVYDILQLVVNILIDFAHLEQGVCVFVDKTVQTEQIVPTLFYTMGFFIDKEINFSPLPPPTPPPPTPNTIIFQHNFAGNLNDMSTNNNNWNEIFINENPNVVFEHNFANNLNDNSTNNNNWSEIP